jgi:ATP-binding cassette subfamily C protein CydC
VSGASPIRALVGQERRRQAGRLVLAALCAAGAAAAAVSLLGLSGWFLTGAALAGAAGPVAVGAFNYLLPSAAIRFLAIARTALRYGERLIGHTAALKALAEIRPALFAGLAAAPVERALSLSTGEATARLVQDVDAIETLFVQTGAPWAALAATLTALALTAVAGVAAAGVFLAALAVQLCGGHWIGANRSRDPGGRALREAGALKDALQAYAGASAELRCYGLTEAVVDELMRIDAPLVEARRRSWSALAEMTALQPALTGFGVAGVLAVSTHAPAPLAAVAALAAAVALEGTGGLLAMFDRRGPVDTAAERLDEVLSAPATLFASAAVDERPAIDIRIGDAVFHLAAGERWALVGRSGCGKTRTLQALVGLRGAEAGEIALAGRDLADIDTGGVRSLFSYAAQDAPMISGTVRENLALADPKATDADLWRVLDDAVLIDKVRAMAGGLDAWIGEGGGRLSGGERKRLSLARALLRPAPWLLLDEPTEGLDLVTEARVVANLAAHLDRTGQGLILVSHRPAARVLADRCILLGPAHACGGFDVDQRLASASL